MLVKAMKKYKRLNYLSQFNIQKKQKNKQTKIRGKRKIKES